MWGTDPSLLSRRRVPAPLILGVVTHHVGVTSSAPAPPVGKIRVVLHGYLRSRDQYLKELELELPGGEVEAAAILEAVGLASDRRYAIFVDRKRLKDNSAKVAIGSLVEIFSIIGGG